MTKIKAFDGSVFDIADDRVELAFSGIDGLAKRAFDYTASFSLILFTLPLLFAIAVIIKIQDGGPVLFSHKRCGQGGRLFPCLKFRTMRTNADQALDDLLARDPAAREEWHRTRKLRNDPRITPIGRFLRKSSLDELPQLFNILRGDMSLIGPRPVTTQELDRYGALLAYYYAARPGITGMWQVNGRNRLTYEERVIYDAEYVRDWTFARDVKILAKTVPAVLSFDGAC